MHGEVEQARKRKLRGYRHSGNDIPLAVTGHGHVYGQCERVITRFPATLDELPVEAAVFEYVNLKQLGPAGRLGCFLDAYRR